MLSVADCLVERVESVGDFFIAEPDPERVSEVASQVGQLLSRYGELTTNPGDAQDDSRTQTSDITFQSKLYRRVILSEPGFTWRSITTITLPVYEHPIEYEDLRIETTNDVTQEPRWLYRYIFRTHEEDGDPNNMPARSALRRLKKARRVLRRTEKQQHKVSESENTEWPEQE